RELPRASRRRRAAADDRAPRAAGGRAGPPALAERRARRGVRVDAQRAHAGAARRLPFGEPVARARVPPGRVLGALPQLLRHGGDVRALSRPPPAPARACAAARLGRAASPARPDETLL